MSDRPINPNINAPGYISCWSKNVIAGITNDSESPDFGGTSSRDRAWRALDGCIIRWSRFYTPQTTHRAVAVVREHAAITTPAARNLCRTCGTSSKKTTVLPYLEHATSERTFSQEQDKGRTCRELYLMFRHRASMELTTDKKGCQ